MSDEDGRGGEGERGEAEGGGERTGEGGVELFLSAMLVGWEI